MDERKGPNLIIEMCSFVLLIFWEFLPAFWKGHFSSDPIFSILISLKGLALSLSEVFLI
jgi:hypothetical protein